MWFWALHEWQDKGDDQFSANRSAASRQTERIADVPSSGGQKSWLSGKSASCRRPTHGCMYYYLPWAGDDVFFSTVGSKDRFLIVDDSSRVLFDSLFLKKIVSEFERIVHSIFCIQSCASLSRYFLQMQSRWYRCSQGDLPPWGLLFFFCALGNTCQLSFF